MSRLELRDGVTAGSDAPDSVAPPPGNRRFPLLDGMRAIAVMSVLIFHVAFFADGSGVPAERFLLHLNVGVTIFFVISGFLLYRPFIAHRVNPAAAAPRVAQYAKRRALRIFPAYWLALTALTLIPGAVGVSGGEWLSQYALVHSIPFTSNPQSCLDTIFSCGLAQTWSLVVELSFYAVLPLWFLAAERFARGRPLRSWAGLELAGLAVLSAISVLLQFGGAAPTTEPVVNGLVTGFVFWFSLGMALAIASVVIEASPSRPRVVSFIAVHPGSVWLAAASLYIILALSLPVSAFLFESGPALAAHLGFGLIALLLMLPAVFGDDSGGLPRRILANRAVAWAGLVSYGIFLWHYAVTIDLGFEGSGLSFWPLLIITVAVSVAAATISYYGLERPLLRLKYRSLRRARSRSSPPAPG